MTNISTEQIVEKNFSSNRLIFALVFATLIFWLFAQSVMITFPSIKEDISFVNNVANLSVSVTSMVSGCLLLLFGSLADRSGRLKFVRLGLVLNVISCLILIISKHQYIFFFGRVLSGISAACILSSTLGIIKYFFDGKERQRAISYAMIGSFGGSSLCTFFSSSMSHFFGWESIFILSIVLSAITLWMLFPIPETQKNNKEPYQFDFWGLITLFIAVISISLLTQSFPTKVVVGLIIAFILSSFVFVKIEKKRKEHAMINLALFTIKPFRASMVINFILNISVAFIIISNLFLRQSLNISAADIAIISLGFPITAVFCMRLGEALFRKTSAKFCVVLGISLCVLGFIVGSLNFFEIHLTIVFMVISYTLCGLGLSIQATALSDIAMSSVPPEYGALAGASLQMAKSIGGAFGIALVLSLFTMFSQIYSIAQAARFSFWILALTQVLNILYVFHIFSKKQS